MGNSRSRDSMYLLCGMFLHYNSMTVCLNPKLLPEYYALIFCPGKEFPVLNSSILPYYQWQEPKLTWNN